METEGCSCFDRLSTNGESPTSSSPVPFALSLSKGGSLRFSLHFKKETYSNYVLFLND